MSQSDTSQNAITQWILETYPRDAAIILYEAILDGRLPVPTEEMLSLLADSPALAAYKEARAIFSLARDQLYYTLLTAVQNETKPC